MHGHDTELARLRQDVRYLKDRSAILDRVASHARGHDRHDVTLLRAAYTADGTDEHGRHVNSASTYAQWANPTHAAAAELHTHNITTHTCEIDPSGDTAHCESYVLVGLLLRDGATVQLLSGRYVDRLERDADGETWRIALRRCTVDWSCTADASALNSRFFKEQRFLKGVRDTDDVSYDRPLRLDDTPRQRW